MMAPRQSLRVRLAVGTLVLTALGLALASIVGSLLLRDFLAQYLSTRHPPAVAYIAQLEAAAQRAKAARRGIWRCVAQGAPCVAGAL